MVGLCNMIPLALNTLVDCMGTILTFFCFATNQVALMFLCQMFSHTLHEYQHLQYSKYRVDGPPMTAFSASRIVFSISKLLDIVLYSCCHLNIFQHFSTMLLSLTANTTIDTLLPVSFCFCIFFSPPIDLLMRGNSTPSSADCNSFFNLSNPPPAFFSRCLLQLFVHFPPLQDLFHFDVYTSCVHLPSQFDHNFAVLIQHCGCCSQGHDH